MAFSRTSQGKLGIMAEAARLLFSLKRIEEAGESISFLSLSLTGPAPLSAAWTREIRSLTLSFSTLLVALFAFISLNHFISKTCLGHAVLYLP
jgi:hypothetical protein